MKPLIVLALSFLISSLFSKLNKKKFEWKWSIRISLSSMLMFTSIGHFIFIEGMSKMIPSFIPYKSEIVILSGLLEIVFALGILVEKYSFQISLALIIFLIMALPLNIYASHNHINYQTGALDGPGIEYLWFRIPLQIFFIVVVILGISKRKQLTTISRKDAESS